MLEHGRKNIVYIGGSEQDAATGIARRQGVQDALREAGLNADGLPRAYCAAFSMEEGHRCMEELLARCPALDGVVCVTDTVAFGALRVLRDAGRKVGQDVGLAGIGDNWAGKVVEPGDHHPLLSAAGRAGGCPDAAAKAWSTRSGRCTGAQTTLGYTLVERGSL